MTTKAEAMETCWAAVERLMCAMVSIEAAALQMRIIAAQPEEPITGDTVTLGGWGKGEFKP